MQTMTEKKTILIVEDEVDLAEIIGYQLEKEGFVCRRLHDGMTALTEIQKNPPDLILLDRMLPRLSGDELAVRLKRDRRTADIPVIMLTAKAEEADELVGFALGADDYVRKPISMNLLLARIAAVLRRREATETGGDTLRAGPIFVDKSRHEVTVDNQPVSLTATEFRILATLMGARGRVLDRDQLIDAALGAGVAVTNRTIDVHIAALRKKLGPPANWVQTVRGVGYTFREPRSA